MTLDGSAPDVLNDVVSLYLDIDAVDDLTVLRGCLTAPDPEPWVAAFRSEWGRLCQQQWMTVWLWEMLTGMAVHSPTFLYRWIDAVSVDIGLTPGTPGEAASLPKSPTHVTRVDSKRAYVHAEDILREKATQFLAGSTRGDTSGTKVFSAGPRVGVLVPLESIFGDGYETLFTGFYRSGLTDDRNDPSYYARSSFTGQPMKAIYQVRSTGLALLTMYPVGAAADA